MSSAKIPAPKAAPAAAARLEDKAEEVAKLLSAMANAKRLMVLCNLIEGERSAGDLAQIVDLSDAALSQHLSKMRLMGLVEPRRSGQTIYYSLKSEQVRVILKTLYGLFCV